jgi:hypothetical protein
MHSASLLAASGDSSVKHLYLVEQHLELILRRERMQRYQGTPRAPVR